MSMSVAEARTEIKANLEKADLIEKKYDGPITNQEDEAEVKRLLSEIDVLESKLAGLEDSEARRNRITAGLDRYSKPAPSSTRPNPTARDYEEAAAESPGDQFVKSREYRDLKLNGHFNSNLARVQFAVNMKDGTSLIEWKRRLQYEEKALLYGDSSNAVGGAWTSASRAPGYVDIRQREITVLDLIPRVQTDSDVVEYVRETAFTNNAASVAEATATTGTTGLKPESVLTYAIATSPVETVAHWIPVTNKMLSDAPAIRGIINGRLLLGLDLALETLIIEGNGTTPNISGILDNAINAVNGATLGTMDSIFHARTLVRTVGKGRPNAVIMHPNDWETIRLARENVATGTLGSYLMGPPSQYGPTTIWGLPVIESQAKENVAIVGDFSQGCTLFDREQAAVRVGTIDDQFVRNMQTILAELRAAFVVWRPTMFSQITGV